MKPASQKSPVTIQHKECRPHQPKCHLLALTTIKTKRWSLPFIAWWASGFPSKWPAILAPSSTQKTDCWRHSELQKERQACSHLLNTAYLHQILLGRTLPIPTTFKSYLGTPALEPMPEDCRECRRFLAVASGWASANCWMAACRALREAASLKEGMKRKYEHVDVEQGNVS